MLDCCFLHSRHHAGTAARPDGAQIFVRIHRGVVDANFVVQMRAGAASARSDIAEDVATVDRLAARNSISGHVSEQRRDSMSVIHDYRASVAVHEADCPDSSVSRRDDWRAKRSTNIDPSMERAFTVERINAFAERSGHSAFYRPQ